MSVTSSRIGNLRRWLRPMLPLRNWTAQASIAHWFYVVGSLIFAIYLMVILIYGIVIFTYIIVILILGVFVDEQTLSHALPIPILGFLADEQTSLYALSIPAAIAAIGLIYEIFRRIELIWKNPVGKWILGGAVVLVGLVSTVLARKLINLVVLVDASHFPTATFTLTILTTILVWWSVIIFFSMFLFIIMFLFTILEGGKHFGLGSLSLTIRNNILYRFFLKKPKVRKSLQTTTHSKWIKRIVVSLNIAVPLGRVLGSWGLGMVLLLSYLPISTVTDDRLSRTIVTTIVLTEYYPLSTCSNHRSGEWVAFIGGDKISVAIPDQVQGYVFEVRPCDS